MKKEYLKEDLTREELLNLTKKFCEDVKNNVYSKEGNSMWVYWLSKMFLHAYARIMGKSDAFVKRNIQINCAHPGWVKTDLTGPEAPLTIDQGALTPCSIFDLPWTISDKQGKLFSDCKPISF